MVSDDLLKTNEFVLCKGRYARVIELYTFTKVPWILFDWDDCGRYLTKESFDIAVLPSRPTTLKEFAACSPDYPQKEIDAMAILKKKTQQNTAVNQLKTSSEGNWLRDPQNSQHIT